MSIVLILRIHIHCNVLKQSSSTGVFLATFLMTFLPMISPKNFGANPNPGCILRIVPSVITLPAFKSFTKYNQQRNFTLFCSPAVRP